MYFRSPREFSVTPYLFQAARSKSSSRSSSPDSDGRRKNFSPEKKHCKKEIQNVSPRRKSPSRGEDFFLKKKKTEEDFFPRKKKTEEDFFPTKKKTEEDFFPTKNSSPHRSRSPVLHQEKKKKYSSKYSVPVGGHKVAECNHDEALIDSSRSVCMGCCAYMGPTAISTTSGFHHLFAANSKAPPATANEETANGLTNPPLNTPLNGVGGKSHNDRKSPKRKHQLFFSTSPLSKGAGSTNGNTKEGDNENPTKTTHAVQTEIGGSAASCSKERRTSEKEAETPREKESISTDHIGRVCQPTFISTDFSKVRLPAGKEGEKILISLLDILTDSTTINRILLSGAYFFKASEDPSSSFFRPCCFEVFRNVFLNGTKEKDSKTKEEETKCIDKTDPYVAKIEEIKCAVKADSDENKEHQNTTNSKEENNSKDTDGKECAAVDEKECAAVTSLSNLSVERIEAIADRVKETAKKIIIPLFFSKNQEPQRPKTEQALYTVCMAAHLFCVHPHPKSTINDEKETKRKEDEKKETEKKEEEKKEDLFAWNSSCLECVEGKRFSEKTKKSGKEEKKIVVNEIPLSSVLKKSLRISNVSKLSQEAIALAAEAREKNQ